MLSPYSTGRFSLNLIDSGLKWHWDFNNPKESDLSITIPGMTFVVHLGTDSEDEVYLDFQAHDDTFHLKPCMAYVFPGYAFQHRTKHTFQENKPRRYSISIFRTFRERCRQLADAYVHAWFPEADDNHQGRTEQVLKHFDAHINQTCFDGITRALISKDASAPDPHVVQPYAWLEPFVEVAISNVHGNGLFAKRNIPAGSVICWYSGTCAMKLDPNNTSDFILDVEWTNPDTKATEVWYLDAINPNTSAGRWANDAINTEFENNARYESGPLVQHPKDKDTYYVFVTATRDIWKGEEIFISYGDPYWTSNPSGNESTF